MELKDLLKIEPGVTALIGSGGKTTCMYALARELSESAKVIICTSTHIYPPTHLTCLVTSEAAEIGQALRRENALCVGTHRENGKFGPSELPFSELEKLADYVIVEADGSRGRPLKAHASHEPVIPENANQVIALLGVSGIGRPISEAAHRPELYASRLGVTPETIVTPLLAAEYLKLENLHTRVLVNQAETAEQKAAAKEIAALLACPVCAGALQKGWLECLF